MVSPSATPTTSPSPASSATVSAVPTGTSSATATASPTPTTTASPTPTASPTAAPVQHIVIIFQENRTPDNLFQGLPGADIASSGLNSLGQTVALQPINLDTNYDLDHSHSGFLREFNAGRMNGFNLEHSSCPSKACTTTSAYGYVPAAQDAPYLAMAKQYTFADRMFQSNEGPSFPAHQYIIAGTSINAVGSNLSAAENPVYGSNQLNC
ncbi:MAG TPA: alkaline phosphatase family protein, partial [Candidatus Baltobacteraceae bacterium]